MGDPGNGGSGNGGSGNGGSGDGGSGDRAGVVFGGVCPIFRVAALDAAVAYYVERLGFAVDWHYPGSIASVTRGGVSLFLSENDQGTPVTWAWVGVSDAEALHEELRARGATIRQPPTNFAWALELQVEDPDGNVLRLGSDPKPGVAHGPWKDMNGVLWRVADDGSWTSDTAGVVTAGVDTAGVVTTTGAGTTPAVSTPAPTTPAVSAEERARTLRSAAESAVRDGDHTRARTLWEAAARAYEAVGDTPGLAVSAAWSARMAWRSNNDLTRAREWLAAARKASDATDDPSVWKLVREIGLELGG
ncbi:glyoxalase superfamily protein [Roseisolibacter sp. H3M3-2]|uniref:glyoxalase superfamily protein n=1 Tax=Roseisolibacter sp. H3M3-2 TaxID=3031323 RepID=UPI0023DBBB5A|nr:glyoxalase superfamily protein [Roseisolibacter sp. H3M3-2]MDF1502362.1 glyoxalase superfamily protein [Roseisolibacter sp. H3M3-2]